MRCAVCHSYIPEGLPSPVICPQCGRGADAQTTNEPPKLPAVAAAPPLPTAEPAAERPPLSSPFAPPELPPQLPGTAGAATSGAHSRLGLENTLVSGASDTGSQGFAPYFSLVTSLAFSPSSTNVILQHPSRGSMSFGPQGLSIVFDNGRHWEKLHYRDITAIRAQDDSVLITTRDSESRLTLFHPWLPAWLSKPRRARAEIFVELFTRVKSGLTPYEVSLFRRRLQ